MLSTLKNVYIAITALLDEATDCFITYTERTDGWTAFRKDYLRKHGKCVACGATSMLRVHHIVPFYVDRSKEFDESNLVTMCMTYGNFCHYYYGHGGDYRSYNPHVLADVASVAFALERGDAAEIERLRDSAEKSRRLR